ncbi:MAG TPA: glycosyltransferase, partial [Gemmatirosa sp.]
DRILTVGRLVPEKRVDLLVRAFALARGRFGSPQRLTVVGDGPERPALEQLAAALGVADAVDFAGSIYDPASLAPHFNAAWAAVSPGGIGLAAVQSLAFGVPVVLAEGEPHGPEASSLADGENAVFFARGAVDAMADALVALEREPVRWAALARTARATSDANFGLDRMTAAFDQAVRHVCAS